MKKEELIALGLTDEQIEKVFIINGKDVEKHKAVAESSTAELQGLRTQLESANSEINGFKELDVDGIKKKVAEWETKYTADTAALKKQSEDKDYAYAIRDAAANISFSSESAKRTFIADAIKAQLAIQDDKVIGFDDFKAKYAQSDAAAFAEEKADDMPIFTKSVNTQNSVATDTTLRAAMGLSTN